MRRLAAGALALLAAVVAHPDRARAGCGDYVMVRGAHLGAHSDRQMLLEHDATMHAGHGANSPRCPCDGPACSSDSRDPAAPPAKVNLSGEHWAFLAGNSALEPDPAASRVAEPHANSSDGYVRDLLRPPR